LPPGDGDDGGGAANETIEVSAEVISPRSPNISSTKMSAGELINLFTNDSAWLYADNGYSMLKAKITLPALYSKNTISAASTDALEAI